MLDFPYHPRLNAEEHHFLAQLVEREPLLRPTSMVTALIRYAMASVARDPQEFQRLLGLYRLRMQAGGLNDRSAA